MIVAELILGLMALIGLLLALAGVWGFLVAIRSRRERD